MEIDPEAEVAVPPQHYFAATPSVPSDRRVVETDLVGRRLRLITDTGVFSGHDVDRGTRLLLENAPSPPPGDVLDLGCGYGPIAVTLGLAAPASRIWAVDVNGRALSLARENAAANGAANVQVLAPADVPDTVRFSAIYSNPPIRIGKPALHDLLSTWLARLTPGGQAYLVVARNLGADSLAGWLGGEGWEVSRARSQKGFRVLIVEATHPAR